MDNVNWKSYRNLPRWPGIGHLAEVEQEKNDEDKLIFFFPRKVQWKHTETRVLHGRGKEDKSPVRGRKQVCICVHYGLFSKEDKYPARGRWMLTVGSIENRKRCCYGIFVCDGIVGKSVI